MGDNTTVVRICWDEEAYEAAIDVLELFSINKNKLGGFDKYTALSTIIKLKRGISADRKLKKVSDTSLTLVQANLLNREIARFIKLTKSDKFIHEREFFKDMNENLTNAISL